MYQILTLQCDRFGSVGGPSLRIWPKYGPKHPPAEVYPDLSKPKPLKKETER